jgi:hypothetical protein
MRFCLPFELDRRGEGRIYRLEAKAAERGSPPSQAGRWPAVAREGRWRGGYWRRR